MITIISYLCSREENEKPPQMVGMGAAVGVCADVAVVVAAYAWRVAGHGGGMQGMHPSSPPFPFRRLLFPGEPLRVVPVHRHSFCCRRHHQSWFGGLFLEGMLGSFLAGGSVRHCLPLERQGATLLDDCRAFFIVPVCSRSPSALLCGRTSCLASLVV